MALVTKRTFINNGIGTEAGRLLLHALQGRLAGLMKQLGVTGEFATDDVFQTGHQVAAEVLGAHGVTLNRSLDFKNRVARNRFSIQKNHLAANMGTFFSMTVSKQASLRRAAKSDIKGHVHEVQIRRGARKLERTVGAFGGTWRGLDTFLRKVEETLRCGRHWDRCWAHFSGERVRWW